MLLPSRSLVSPSNLRQSSGSSPCSGAASLEDFSTSKPCYLFATQSGSFLWSKRNSQENLKGYLLSPVYFKGVRLRPVFGTSGLAAERKREGRVWKPREGGHSVPYKVGQLAPHLVSSVERKNQSKAHIWGLSLRTKLRYSKEDNQSSYSMSYSLTSS